MMKTISLILFFAYTIFSDCYNIIIIIAKWLGYGIRFSDEKKNKSL